MQTPNKERIQLLVDALRSGKYRQTQHTLAEYDKKAKRRKFCCLGVACEVARANGVELDILRDRNGFDHYNGNTSSLPTIVQDWFGLDYDPLLINENDLRFTASYLNDHRGYKFVQIADAFERTFLKAHDADS